MPDDVQTSNAEPAEKLTSTQEPASSTSDSPPQAAQPTLEEMLSETRAKLERLEQNNKGTFQEWQREKQARENLENQVRQLQSFQQSVQTQQPKGMTEEEEEKAYVDALLNQDHARAAEIRRKQRERVIEEANQRFTGYLTQAAQQSGRVNAMGQVLTKMGISANDPVVPKIQERVQQMKQDPAYANAFNNDESLMFLFAAKDVVAEQKLDGKAATEKARQIAVDEAATESSTTGGSGKSQKSTEKMYFNDNERKAINMWAQMKDANPNEIERRQKEKRA